MRPGANVPHLSLLEQPAIEYCRVLSVVQDGDNFDLLRLVKHAVPELIREDRQVGPPRAPAQLSR